MYRLLKQLALESPMNSTGRPSTNATRRRGVLVALCAIGFVGVLGGEGLLAQESRRDGVTLHEYFDPVLVGSGAGQDGEAGVAAPVGPGGPPSLSLEPRRHEMIFSGDGPLSDVPIEAPHGPLDPRAGASRLDDQTDRVDQLDYFANFDPSVLPYKRLIAQNRVIRDSSGAYSIVLESRRERPVPVEGGQGRADEDIFWGTFLMRLDAGERHAIPSVAADQRFLRVDVEPAVAVEFHRDEADNYYVTADYDGLLRINVELAAPRYYFDGELSQEVRWGDFPRALLPGLDAETSQIASQVTASIGVSRRQAPREALRRLVEHYRDFEGKPLPQSARLGDLYEVISKEKVGVCRHRSLAFVISSQFLGIPTRYISNEAHAFVEIYWPGQGWRRIDLGGAAEDVNFRDGGQTDVHDGAVNDPFPQPPAYLSELDRIRGSGGGDDGLSEGQESSALDGDGPPQEDRLQEDAPQEGQRGQAIGDGPGDHPGDEPGDMSMSMRTSEAEEMSPTVEERDDRTATRVRILRANNEVMRGDRITVVGDLATASGAPLPDRLVRIYLAPSERHDTGASRFLGEGHTNGVGRFELEVGIEADVSIGRWSLRAVFDGDSEHQETNSSP
ncbi:MAG: transglutaminase domain-containing protein [Bradymonadaceae bacterium]